MFIKYFQVITVIITLIKNSDYINLIINLNTSTLLFELTCENKLTSITIKLTNMTMLTKIFILDVC